MNRKRAQKQASNYAEDRRVRPDAKRESNHSNDGEPKVLAQLPHCVTKVLNYSNHLVFSLLVAQRHHGIELHGPARRDVACVECDHGQEQCRSDECERIGGAYSYK